VTAATVFRAGDWPSLAADYLVAAADDLIWARRDDGESWEGPLSVAAVLCPTGSTGCPDGVDSIARLELYGVPHLLVRHAETAYLTAVMSDEATGAAVFTWVAFRLSDVSCEH
jgi:hypothetical protein